MTRVDVAMRSRIVTARRETTEETTRRRIARGVDVARASRTRETTRASRCAFATTTTTTAATPARETTNMDSRRRTVSFAREDDLERSVGVADADVDRADVWELPRTCDSCGNYILPGRARWACARCLEEGVEYDACETCLARLAREESSRVKRGKRKKGAKKRKMDAHAHGRASFVLVEAPDEEDEDEKR